MLWSGAMHKVSSAVRELVHQRMREKIVATAGKDAQTHVILPF